MSILLALLSIVFLVAIVYAWRGENRPPASPAVLGTARRVTWNASKDRNEVRVRAFVSMDDDAALREHLRQKIARYKELARDANDAKASMRIRGLVAELQVQL